MLITRKQAVSLRGNKFFSFTSYLVHSVSDFFMKDEKNEGKKGGKVNDEFLGEFQKAL